MQLVDGVEMCLQCRLERANCLPCSYVHRQWFQALEPATANARVPTAKVHNRGTDYGDTVRTVLGQNGPGKNGSTVYSVK